LGGWGGQAVKNAFEYEAELAALREELAALREELAESGRADHLRQRIAFLTTEVHARANERDALQQRLTAAEQRTKDFLEIMRSVRLNASPRLFSNGQLARIDELLIAPDDSGAL
jgi:chromosome segregation ATPase